MVGKILPVLKKTYQLLTAAYFDYVRDSIVAARRFVRREKRALILDMDWYRWCLDEREARLNLHEHAVLKKHADFIRVERKQIFRGGDFHAGITPENFRSISHDGFNLWGISKATIISDLATHRVNPDDPEHGKKISEIYKEAASGIDNLKKLFNRLKPDSVFVCQGGVFDSRCVVEVARRFGINVVGAENSMIGGLIILDNLSGQIINRHSLARMGSDIMEANEVTSRQREEVFDLWQKKISEKSAEHKTGGINGEDDLRSALNIPSNCKILLLLGQVGTDASIVLDSPLYREPLDMIESVARASRVFKDTVLVIRLHPKEFEGKAPGGRPYERMTYKKLIERGVERIENVRIAEDPSYNTYTLAKMAHAGITINSQAGFEMCLLGKPVMVMGNAFYGNKGFTVDLAHPSALGATLDFLVNKAVMDPEQHKRALNFLYFFYTRQLFDRKLSINEERLCQIFRLYP